MQSESPPADNTLKEQLFSFYFMLYSKAVNSPSETVSSGEARIISANLTNPVQKSSTILQRIAAADTTAARECPDAHGNLVWALAKQITDSREEAENATQGIFLDIWKYADRFNSSEQNETDFILLIVRRWLIRRQLQSALASFAAADLKTPE